jgi:hypothetical protein
MTVLTVKSVSDPRVASVDDDPYILFSADWVSPGGAGLPVYYFATDQSSESGKNGFIEVKLERLTGEVIGAVVVSLPTARSDIPDSIPFENGAVRVDMEPWVPNPDLVPTKGRFDESESLSVSFNDSHIYFAFCDELPVRWVMGGTVGFGVGLEGELTGLIAENGKSGWADRLLRKIS